jgi:hypothetical protein
MQSICGNPRPKTNRRQQKTDMTLMYGAPDLLEDVNAKDSSSEEEELDADMEEAVSSPAGGWPETQGAGLDAPSSPPYEGPASSPARGAAATTSNTLPPSKNSVQPIFASTLMYKTKEFKTPFNLQYLGTDNDNCLLFSDGVHVMPASVGPSYRSLFTANIIQPMSIVTILISSRERTAPFNVKFTNLRVPPKQSQTYQQIGNPIRY